MGAIVPGRASASNVLADFGGFLRPTEGEAGRAGRSGPATVELTRAALTRSRGCLPPRHLSGTRQLKGSARRVAAGRLSRPPRPPDSAAPSPGLPRALSYDDADGGARQEETRPARAPARRGRRHRRLGPARPRAADAGGRASRHRLVLRAEGGRHVRPAGDREHQGRGQGEGRGVGQLGLRPRSPAAQSTGEAASSLLRGLGCRAGLAGGIPARRRRQGRLHRDVQGQHHLAQSEDGQAPLDAQGRTPARVEPCARRAPRLRLLPRRSGARAPPHRRQARVALPRRRAHRVVAAARRRHALFRRRGRHADRAQRAQRPPPLARPGSAARSRARPPTAAACSWSAPTTATSTATTPGRARGAGRPRDSAPTAGSGRAASTPRRRSRTAGSTSARPTAACTRSWRRPARSRGASRPAATSTPGPAAVHQTILFGSYDH